MPIIRPLNYPAGVPGKGYRVFNKVLVVNLIGRTFMNNYECPFRTMDKLLEELKNIPKVIIVDFHAEATSEKVALGRYLDGRVSAVLGTHTHVGTIDTQIFKGGTAYVTDIGMTGPSDSIIGDDVDSVIQRFLTQMPHRLTVGKGKPVLNAVIVEVDENTGKAINGRTVSLVDLHIHSTASDGKLSPSAIIAKAAEIGLRVVSITDHDCVDGVTPALQAAKAYASLTFIPGVEISTDLADGEAHVLGYFIDYASPELAKSLVKFRDSRLGRGKRMVEKLAGLGIFLEWTRVQAIAGDGAIGRPHIARAMLEKGYIASFEEAFNKYIGHGCPAYVSREKMTPEEAVALIVRSQGLPVLAHPFTVKDPEAMIISLKKAGLVGVETYYKDNTPQQTAFTLRLAEKYGLIPTGGTDYHGIENTKEVMMGGVEVPLEAAERLIAMAKKLH
jgi:predicted metal-dependent phosphoesterase TrpH